MTQRAYWKFVSNNHNLTIILLLYLCNWLVFHTLYKAFLVEVFIQMKQEVMRACQKLTKFAFLCSETATDHIISRDFSFSYCAFEKKEWYKLYMKLPLCRSYHSWSDLIWLILMGDEGTIFFKNTDLNTGTQGLPLCRQQHMKTEKASFVHWGFLHHEKHNHGQCLNFIWIGTWTDMNGMKKF